MAGNFNGWNPADSDYQLLRQNDSLFTFRFDSLPQNAEFKFTRGSWATAEMDSNGADLPNRKLPEKAVFPLSLRIARWDRVEKPSTASANVQVLTNDFPMKALGRTRKIWVYLPAAYPTEKDRSFPVLYLQDGQNLFDQKTAPFGEWQVDETLDSLAGLYPQNQVIVVGIDHGADFRLEEYTPYPNARYGGGKGDQYLQFLVNELKPAIDSQFRTLPDKANTAIGGSSLGGLISFHALIQYPETFGMGLIFSPSFWFSEKHFELTSQQIQRSQSARFFLLVGGNEEPIMTEGLAKMQALLAEKGMNAQQIKAVVDPAGNHNEAFWRAQFPQAFKWLYQLP